MRLGMVWPIEGISGFGVMLPRSAPGGGKGGATFFAAVEVTVGQSCIESASSRSTEITVGQAGVDNDDHMDACENKG